jgi:acetyl esterase/lipase
VGEVQCPLYVFEPGQAKDREKRPAIIFFHGGAWEKGSPRQFYWQCDYLARRGMWAASAQYRLTPSGISLADCVADAFDAVRYLREHAEELGVDPAHIAVGGGSAGGHLAAITATAPETNPRGNVSGRANLMVLFNPALFADRAQGTIKIDDFTKDTPPGIHFYGTEDRMLNYGKEVLERSEKFGFAVTVFSAQNMGHGFFNNPPWRKATIFEVDRFLTEHGYLTGNPTIQVPEGAKLDRVK